MIGGAISRLASSIGAKLILSHSAVILLSLSLAALTFVYLLQPYQTQQALDRLSALAIPLAAQVRILEVGGSAAPEIAGFLDEQAKDLGVRILLVRQSDQSVAHDTGGALVGYTLVFDGARRPGSLVLEGTADVPGEGSLALVSMRPPPPPPAGPALRRRFGVENRQFTVALAARRSTLAGEWLQLVPRLAVAALVSLFASIAVAFVISRSISRRLAGIARASEAMARGDYGQRAEVRGGDEIGRLASAFNTMANEVAESHQTLRAFLADVSHELRTPLTTVQGFAQAILDGTVRGQQGVEESARVIKEDDERLSRMVEDLLDLSRIQSGQTPMEVRSVNLCDIVSGAVKRARQRAQGRLMRLDLPSEPQYVMADSHRIEEVLETLLTNAGNHTPSDGQISVTVASRGAEVVARVHNTGSFVREADRERIFQRFARGGDAGGNGLGLAIAKEIAHQHAGRIDLESSPDAGTTFTLVLLQVPAPSPRSRREEGGVGKGWGGGSPNFN
jgi:signal transduction histidine kinase